MKAKGIVRAGYDWREGWVVLEKLLTDYAKEHKPSVLERQLKTIFYFEKIIFRVIITGTGGYFGKISSSS